MNVEKLQELADTVRRAAHFDVGRSIMMVELRKWDDVPDQFTLSYCFASVQTDECRTVGCLLGFGLGIGGGVDMENHAHAYARFSDRFSLHPDVTSFLCNPRTLLAFEQYNDITPEEAATAVENVINGAITEREIWHHVLSNRKEIVIEGRHPNERR